MVDMKASDAIKFLNQTDVFFRGKGGKESACIRPSDELIEKIDEMKDLLDLPSRARLLELIVNDFFIRLAVNGATSWPKVNPALIESAKKEVARIAKESE